MRTAADFIRESDPLSHEPLWSPQERQRVRQNILRGAAEVIPSNPVFRQPFVVAIVMLCLVLMAGAAILPRLWLPPVLAQASVRFEIRLAEETPASGLQLSTGAAGAIYLHRDAIVTNIDIAAARVVATSPLGFGVEVTFTPSAAERILRMTRPHVGKPIAILIDGKVVASPSMKSAISSSAQINGDFDRVQAERIAKGMIGR
jgi:hypothetical protein